MPPILVSYEAAFRSNLQKKNLVQLRAGPLSLLNKQILRGPMESHRDDMHLKKMTILECQPSPSLKAAIKKNIIEHFWKVIYFFYFAFKDLQIFCAQNQEKKFILLVPIYSNNKGDLTNLYDDVSRRIFG